MAKLTKEEIIKLARLSKIKLSESEVETFRRMDSFSILKSIIDSILVVLAVFIILPILLGVHRYSSFSDLKLAAKTIFVIILIATGARIISSRFWSNQNSFTKGGTHLTFFICVFLISFIMHRIIEELLVKDIPNVFPSFWMCLGFVFISYFILLAFSFILAFIIIPLSEDGKKYVRNVLLTGMSLLMGIIYMRMYCYHILEKVKEININWNAI